MADAKQIIKKQYGFNTENCQFIFGASILNEERPVGELKVGPSNYIIIYCPTRQKSIAVPEKVDSIPQRMIDPRPAPQLPPTELPDSPDVEIPTPKPPASGQGAPDANSGKEPADFSSLVNDLQEMGFSEEQSKQALRACNYDKNNAVDYLLSGQAGAPPPPPPQPSPPRPPSERGGRYGELQGTFDALTDDEKAAVNRLEQLGLDPITVLQVYIVCEKDEAATTSCINDMMS